LKVTIPCIVTLTKHESLAITQLPHVKTKIPQILYSSFRNFSHFCITKVGTTFACTQETHIQTFTHQAKKCIIENKKKKTQCYVSKMDGR